MNFQLFSKTINDRFNIISTEPMFRTSVSKDALYEHYLASFPEGTNPIYLERTEHDCQTCRNFIKNIGNAVGIHDGKLQSIWNSTTPLEEPYTTVAKAMHELVTSQPIISIFLHNEPLAGKVLTHQQLENSSIKTWHHFHCTIPDNLYERDIATKLSKANTRAQVHERSLREISLSSAKEVLDLIVENAIYRGAEFKQIIENFILLKHRYMATENKNNFVWQTFRSHGAAIRNSVIGSLLIDLTEGKPLEEAVKSFESKVAPTNYKRPKALVTKRMLEQAIKVIDEQGLRDSLPRRHAISSDVSVNNVLFVDKSTKMLDKDPLLALLPTTTEINAKTLEKAKELSMEDFLVNVLPNTTSLSLVTSPAMSKDQVHITAPVNASSKPITTWDNNFAWSYAGNTTDSTIAKNVKSAGGKLEGILRFSLQWNENGMDNTDLDAHCMEYNGNHISFSNKRSAITGGTLDIDITDPGSKVAVENIVWQELVNGYYNLFVRDYSCNGLKDSFSCEVVFNGVTYTYKYSGNMVSRDIEIAKVTYNNGELSIKHHLKPTTEMSNLELIPVTMMLLSPNHWDSSHGNKHYMFMTDNVKSTEPIRGFYNEFLPGRLNCIRKSMDMLAYKMQCTPDEHGLSGYGFSETSKTSIYLKADNRIFKIII